MIKEQKKRKFMAIFISPDDKVVIEGRHKGMKPQQAACKALTSIHNIYKKNGKNIDGEIKFGLSETTRGSERKNFWYTGKKTNTNPSKLYALPGYNIKKTNLYMLPENYDKNKIYASTEEINEMGGFEEIYEKEEEDIKPLKKYFSTKDIIKMGGFEKIFKKKEEEIIPTIIYKEKPDVKKTKKEELKGILDFFSSKNEDEKIANILSGGNFNKKGYKKSTMKKAKIDI